MYVCIYTHCVIHKSKCSMYADATYMNEMNERWLHYEQSKVKSLLNCLFVISER